MEGRLQTVCKAIASSLILAAPCLPIPVAAQDADAMVFCEYQPSLEDLVGDYMVMTGPGALSSGGVEIPMPNVQEYRATLAMIDGVLVLYADDTQPIDLLPVAADEPDWTWSDSDILEMPNSEDMSLLEGCDINSLLRLSGTGIATSQEGRQFEFTIRLFAGRQGWLYGGQSSWSVDGMTMNQRLELSGVDN
ncbi:hypothetical protein [Anianabacter salinae]|uniref:hypothetical protein n=1 Tax=Anianabacter salinae TaxID=2851023 RepID=UPI00225E6BF4|nr:hypothetical protein [Anianabacter salinae]MBV0914115.1 hypothetical protein [Anianabacter salinae]